MAGSERRERFSVKSFSSFSVGELEQGVIGPYMGTRDELEDVCERSERVDLIRFLPTAKISLNR
jgi:hypothetical protein